MGYADISKGTFTRMHAMFMFPRKITDGSYIFEVLLKGSSLSEL